MVDRPFLYDFRGNKSRSIFYNNENAPSQYCPYDGRLRDAMLVMAWPLHDFTSLVDWPVLSCGKSSVPGEKGVKRLTNALRRFMGFVLDNSGTDG